MAINFIPKKPDAVVIFTGLLMVHLDEENNLCEVGIHPHQDHVLRLKIELRTHGNHLFKGIVWEHTYPKLNQNLRINVTTAPNPNPPHPSFARYQQRGRLNRSEQEEKIQRHSQHPPYAAEVLVEDYRWAMNPGLFHSNGLNFRASAFQPSIKLNSGIFFATKLLDMGQGLDSQSLFIRNRPIPDNPEFADHGIERHVNNPDEVTLTAVAQAIGANLYFTEDNGSIALQWEPFNGSETSPTPQAIAPLPDLPLLPNGHYYRIIFNNDCRDNDGHVCLRTRNLRGYFTDIPLYYERGHDLLDGLTEDDRLDARPSPLRISRMFPCIPVSGVKAPA